LPIVLDAFGQGAINIPYVSVTVCPPGTGATSAACQTIDHVQVDTGASGLRLLKPVLSTALSLPAVSGQAIGECMQFADGYTWGSVRLADIYLAGEVARNVPIQDIGDAPGGASVAPTTCSSGGGTIENTVASLGANGILGVGLFINDSGSYYTCSGGSCSVTTTTDAQIVKNPVALFAADNNGVVIDLPAVVAATGDGNLTGSLIFGIGTQANNALNSETVYPTNSSGDFTTTFGGSTFTSFIDSGSNGLYFNDPRVGTSNAIPVCTATGYSGFYCPPSPLSLSATNIAAGGSPSGIVNFTLVDVSARAANAVAANIGGPPGVFLNSYFDWGLPFFFGRKVFTAIEGKTAETAVGPYWAY
jgi:hypothetical protein